MFLHFGVATIFIILGIWAYSSAALGKAYDLQLGLMLFIIALWFVLYAFVRTGRSKGTHQMQQLYDFMIATRSEYRNTLSACKKEAPLFFSITPYYSQNASTG